MRLQLSTFGFTENEQAVLVHLLTQGPASALELSRATQIKRPTTYLALESLTQAGLVTKKMVGRGMLFESIPREFFARSLMERARTTLRAQEQSAEELSHMLANLQPQSSNEVGGLVVESLASERGLYREMYQNLLRGDYKGIFNPQLAVTSRSKPLLLDFLKQTSLIKPHIREIAVAGPMCDWYRAQIRNPNHKFRTLPASTNYITDLILTDGYVILLDYSPHSRAAVKIRQPNLYASFSALFDRLWG
jgi:predicted transcriptional regulator